MGGIGEQSPRPLLFAHCCRYASAQGRDRQMDRHGRCRRRHSRQEGGRDMSLLAAIRKLWHSIAPRTHSDVEEEFRSTLDAYQEDLIRQGLPEEEARRRARIDLGQPAAQNENYRDAIGLRFFDELGETSATASAPCAATLASPPSPCSPSRSASAPPRRCSRSSTPSCCTRFLTPAPTAS